MPENPYESPKIAGPAREAFPMRRTRLRRRLVVLAAFFVGMSLVAVGEAVFMLYDVNMRGHWSVPFAGVPMLVGVALVLWALAMSVGLAPVPWTRPARPPDANE